MDILVKMIVSIQHNNGKITHLVTDQGIKCQILMKKKFFFYIVHLIGPGSHALMHHRLKLKRLLVVTW